MAGGGGDGSASGAGAGAGAGSGRLSPAGRALGLDVGSKTIGVAVSDPLGLTAQPVETVRRSGRRADAEAVAKIARQKDARRIVVGLPLRTDGGEGPEAAEARRMAEAVAALLPGIELHMQDERFTTAQAERMLVAADVRRQKRREVVDTVAAVLILQGWLDSQGR